LFVVSYVFHQLTIKKHQNRHTKFELPAGRARQMAEIVWLPGTSNFMRVQATDPQTAVPMTDKQWIYINQRTLIGINR
jgi:hypothetical protein